jgi:hypothetical protein
MGISQLSQSASPGAGVTAARSINIAILAMGGEGGGVLADWIVDLAENSGFWRKLLLFRAWPSAPDQPFITLNFFPRKRRDLPEKIRCWR